MDPSEPSKSPPQLFFRLNLAQRTLMKWVDREMLEKVGGTATQIAALFYLLENNGCLLVDLSRELLQNKSAITTLVERMEKNHLLCKVPSPTDKRASQLFLTARGKEMGQMALPFVTVYNDALSAGFNEKELSVILRFLDRVIGRFEILPENYFKTMVQPSSDQRSKD